MTRIAITGAAGFIGSNFVHLTLKAHPSWELVLIDQLTYAGNLRNLESALGNGRLRFVRLDICDAAIADTLAGCDYVVHFAAESHVDRSIENADSFVRTNVTGTWNLIEASRRAGIRRFLHVSTDEVYGTLADTGRFTESSPIAPRSPYAATKAASDLLVQSAMHTHRFPAIITRCCNNYGPFQFPEKFIPLMISQAFSGQPLPVYGSGDNVRDWIHVEDHCRALDLILQRGEDGEVYNVGADCERRNLDIAREILALTGQDEKLIHFVPDRPGHDFRYAIDAGKIQSSLGWQPVNEFKTGLAATIDWYRRNANWLQETRSGAYRDYFDRHYKRRAETIASFRQ